MEEKESTVSGSPADSVTDSPSPVTSFAAAPPAQPVNMNANTAIDKAFPVTTENTPSLGATTVSTVAGAIQAVGQGTQGGDSSGKKKRGRPRKYDSEGNLIIRSPPAGFSFSPSSPWLSDNSTKKSRGKAARGANWNLFASLGDLFDITAGGDFTPHIVTVSTGEDVAGKIISFTQKGLRGICVLSANGAVSNVTIRQPGSTGGILTYEGRFEILSLTGSFMISETGGIRSKTGGLSVSLAGPDGRVIGGGVGGILTAASPIQIVLGSFIPIGPKPQKRKYNRQSIVPSSAPSGADTVVAAEPISQTKPDTEMVFGQSSREANNIVDETQIPNTSLFSSGWNGSEPASNQSISPDINVSVPSD